MRATLGPILDLLDDGLRLYRRAFAPLLLLASIVGLPLGVAVAALFIADDWLAQGPGALLAGLLLVGGLPLSLYVMGALSRAALMAAAGEPVALGRALAIGPLRMLGMGCYGTLFLVAAGAVVSTATSLFFCAAYAFLGVTIVGLASAASGAGAVGGAAVGLLIVVAAVALLLVYLGALVVNGAVYGGTIYALQPFVQDQLPLGAALRRSFDLLFARLGANLLAFSCASLVFTAASLAVTLAVGLLAPLPALFLLGPESPAAQAISAAAWVAGLTAAAPLLPVWMALLYRQRRAARHGEALAARLEQLRPSSATAAVTDG